MNHNPFFLRELPIDAPFCNRVKELDVLTRHGENKMNVVLFSPRRYGKTSIAKRAMDRLKQKGMIPIYINLYGVNCAEDVSGRIAKGVYEHTKSSKKWYGKTLRWITSWRPVLRSDKEGIVNLTVEQVAGRKHSYMIDEVMETINKLGKEHKKGCCIVMDEFQDITDLPEYKEIEGLLRTNVDIQSNNVYYYLGSRRSILKNMFNNPKRPFFRSSMNMGLSPIPNNEVGEFIVKVFKKENKSCSKEKAEAISVIVKGYAYYLQKLGYCIYENTEKVVNNESIRKGYLTMLKDENPYYEALLSKISLQQRKLLIAICKEPTKEIFSTKYIKSHNLGSLGALQYAVKKLIEMDYIEKNEGIYGVVDPIFSHWLSLL